MELYHGSNLSIPEPKVLTTRFYKDFGFGFYLSKHRPQAEKWARRKATQKGGQATISVYTLSDTCGYTYKRFNGMDDEWLDFIVLCCSGGTHPYDIVEGVMADDYIYDYVESYLSGTLFPASLL